MEKFSHFRDKATGIGPFFNVPITTTAPETIFSVISVIVRVPLILVSLLLILIFSNLPDFAYSFSLPLLQFLLLLCGISSWDIQSEGHKRREASKFFPTHGSIIITNFISPLDGFVFYSLFKCIFVIPVISQDGKEIFYDEVSLFYVMIKALLPPYILSNYGTGNTIPKDLIGYAERAKRSNKVVVVFGEGTTSNGKGLLPLLITNEAILNKKNEETSSILTYPTSIKYGRTYTVTPVPENFFIWLWKLCYGFRFGSVRIRFAIPVSPTDISDGSGVNGLVKQESGSTSIDLGNGYSLNSSSDLGAESLSYKELVSSAICRVGRVKQVGLGIHSKIDFINVKAKGK